jgi:hypothetical protein
MPLLHRVIFVALLALLLVAPFQLYPVFLMKVLCFAVRQRLQPAARLRRAAVVRPCGLFRPQAMSRPTPRRSGG